MATDEQTISWLTKAGFASKFTKLSGNSNTSLHTLSTCLKENGPGLLQIYEEDGIEAHVIVLDDVSLKSGTATIREPFHGWQIDIELSALQRIKPSAFIQITGKNT